MKGESERVKGKNVRLFNGKPLCLHVLESLVSIEAIDQIIINTDSPEIEQLTSSYEKVKIHHRPADLQGHMVSMNKIIQYDIENSKAEHFIQTHSTNPLILSATINKALKVYEEMLSDYDSVFSVTRLQTRLYEENGQALNHDPNILLRTQDLKPLFEENSNFYIFSKESFFKTNGKRIGLKPWLFEVNKLEALDIDEEEDFLLAEAVQKLNIL
ncbi:MAG: acylneuraminate cytidylyltransferase family protein [Bacteroidetes bacterium]|nr:acylneuraminate cytidylyltransferase family protein [Bacteroidota bacterium]